MSDDAYTIEFPEDCTGRRESETPAKGWVDVRVVFPEGISYTLSFYDPVRLAQTAEDKFAAGREYYTEPNLVLLPEVTTENVRKAVADMVDRSLIDGSAPRRAQS